MNRLSSLKSQPEGSPQASQPIPKISEAPSILQRFSPKESLQPKSPPRDQTHTQSSVYIAKVEQYGNQLSSAQSRQTLVRQIEKSGISETTGRPRLQQSERDQYGNIAAVVTAQPDKEQEYSQPSEPQKSSDITPSYYGSQQQQSSASKYNPPIIQPISLNRTEHTNGQVNPQQPRKEVNYGQYGNIPEVIPEEPGNQQTSSDSEMAQTQKPLQYLQYGQQKQAIPEPANSKQISLKPTDEVSNSDISEANPVIPPRSYSEYNQQKQDRFEPEKKQLRPNESPKLPSPIESQMFSNSNVQPESITPETTTTVPIDIYSTFERQYRRPVTRPSKTSEPLWYSRSPPVYLSTPPQYGHQPEEFRSTSGTRRLVIYPTVKFSLPPAYPSYRFANELYNAEYANPAPRRQVIVGYYHFQDSNPFIKRKK